MVEKLPFAYEDALKQAPTPKFKVGDRVHLEDLDTIGVVIDIDRQNKEESAYFVRWQGRIGMQYYSEDELTHAD